MGLGFDNARHLLSRTGFGGTPGEIHAFAKRDRDAAIDVLLGGARTRSKSAPPEWADDVPPSKKERRAMRRELKMMRQEQASELKGWWYREMLQTPSPLTERMTLFWHNHFTSSIRKVKFPPALFRQNALLRKHSLGNFRTLLQSIARDPAMLVYLDGQNSRKKQPNENFARELLELFTLGEGNGYSERDIKEAARAFTGRKVDRETGKVRFVKRAHDDGLKTFMGETGRFKGEDIVEILLKTPATSEYIVARLWREFVSTELDRAEVKRVARVFRQSNYAIAPTLRALLKSRTFFDPPVRGTMVKSPVELIVGTMRLFEIEPSDNDKRLVRLGRGLGQDLFDPPNVKGWPGHTAWITSHTLLIRQQLLRQVTGKVRKRLKKRSDGVLGRWLERKDMPLSDAVAMTAQVLLPIEPIHPLPTGTKVHRVVEHLVLDPSYQLK